MEVLFDRAPATIAGGAQSEDRLETLFRRRRRESGKYRREGERAERAAFRPLLLSSAAQPCPLKQR